MTKEKTIYDTEITEYKPLIKYTGGKFKEYKYFSHLIPGVVGDYYEPFAGGAGVMFQMLNDGRIFGHIHLNDISSELTAFYKAVGTDSFNNALDDMADVWDGIKKLADCINNMKGLPEKFYEIITSNGKVEDVINDPFFIGFVDHLYRDCTNLPKYFSKSRNMVGFNIPTYQSSNIIDSIKDKLTKFKFKYENGKLKVFEPESCNEQIKTSILQSFYFAVRDLYNEERQQGDITPEYLAHWFFIREFCYGSMFRFSKNGFNVPYGGASYNNKDFRAKVDYLKSDDIAEVFGERMSVDNMDFEKYIEFQCYCDSDFVFLDPPYDSTFNEYDSTAFTKEDQERLRKAVENIKCKWMMVIRNTPFIKSLYKDYSMAAFDKNYAFHARGTYDEKQCEHLVITNYDTNTI